MRLLRSLPIAQAFIQSDSPRQGVFHLPDSGDVHLNPANGVDDDRGWISMELFAEICADRFFPLLGLQ